jgi:hypothetical protein
VRPTFSDLLPSFHPDIYAIEDIRDDADGPYFIVLQGKPVRRSDGRKVLDALSV